MFGWPRAQCHYPAALVTGDWSDLSQRHVFSVLANDSLSLLEFYRKKPTADKYVTDRRMCLESDVSENDKRWHILGFTTHAWLVLMLTSGQVLDVKVTEQWIKLCYVTLPLINPSTVTCDVYGVRYVKYDV